jgi:S-adenosylmethionine-diacylglycerol 3-amino-3-carboxypropyl transferase
MRQNPLQFAVVREDPAVEAQLVTSHAARRALLIASGGCTAFALAAEFPSLQLTLVDPNPAQLALVRAKADALATGKERASLFNIGDDHSRGLNASGNFESLFRGLRELLYDLVIPREELLAIFAGPFDGAHVVRVLSRAKFWQPAFAMFFSDALLEAMFGASATQHAEKGSYPGYFRRAIERGLAAPGAADNYFLHHILLGHYLDRAQALPRYLREPPRAYAFELLELPIARAPSLAGYDLISLSNLFDWMDETAIAEVAGKVEREAAAGSCMVFRQLNNQRDLTTYFPSFDFDQRLSDRLCAEERSLFYSRLNIGTKRSA